jgi:hypothetical protein
MPKSSRYPITELPGTLQRSCREAQETFLRALDDAVRTHGAGDHAHQIAYMAEAEFRETRRPLDCQDSPVDCGGGGKVDQLAAHRKSSGQQMQRSAARWAS